jgi:hypothetical protein
MLTTPEYTEPRIMTYKEFVKSDLCKKMVREEIDKERLLQMENSEIFKKMGDNYDKPHFNEVS